MEREIVTAEGGRRGFELDGAIAAPTVEMTTIRKISWEDILGDANGIALIAEYAEECSIPAIGEPHPQPAVYEKLESSGLMQCFGAYDGERLVGFACVLTSMNPHYGLHIATLESLFMSREGRSRGFSSALMEAIEEYASSQGCVGIGYSVKVGSRFERLLTLKGYPRTNAVFYKALA